MNTTKTTITWRIPAGASVALITATLVGCAGGIPASTGGSSEVGAGAMSGVSDAAHTDLMRAAAERYVDELAARAQPVPHTDLMRAAADRYVDELVARARAASSR